MARHHEGKFDPWPIVAGHFATLVGVNGRPQIRDYVQLVVLPLVAGGAAWFGHAAISTGTGSAILTLAGLFAAFLFQLSIQLLDRSASWAEADPPPGPATSRYAILLQELSANAGYASLVSGLTASLVLVAMLIPRGGIERIAAAAVVSVLLHLGVTLLLVATRTYLLTTTYLNAARTGGQLKGP